MTARELESPPSERVTWVVSVPSLESKVVNGAGVVIGMTAHFDIKVRALTAWLAHVAACPELPGCPPFGSCVVRRVG